MLLSSMPPEMEVLIPLEPPEVEPGDVAKVGGDFLDDASSHPVGDPWARKYMRTAGTSLMTPVVIQ